jgi:hypothetical protein
LTTLGFVTAEANIIKSTPGFIILPDFKWSGKQNDDLYLIGIVHKKGVQSIRSLRHHHLPLLRKLWLDGTKAIAARFGVPRSQIRWPILSFKTFQEILPKHLTKKTLFSKSCQ